MIKLLYACGKHQGEVYRIWRNYQDFARVTIDLVANTALNNKLPQKAVFLHYGYGFQENAEGQPGYTNGILGAMNFWLDTFPDLRFEYDTQAEDEEKETYIEAAKRKNFYIWLQRFNSVKGLQLFRTSNELWSYYSNTDSTEECPVWEPNVPAPQQLLEDYPEAVVLLAAGNLINSQQQHEKVAGLWAVEQVLLGKEPLEKLSAKLQGLIENPAGTEKLKVKSELGVIFYAFLSGKFYEEVEEYL